MHVYSIAFSQKYETIFNLKHKTKFLYTDLIRKMLLSSRYVFSWYPFYFDFHSARIIFDVSSGFYLWNINNTKADMCKK